ncbi:DegT/DnrJ/EryC1/StrS family aminotransferase, partial [Methanocalculus sp.]|uniref:DegT/DnrJ/EryC1/StrS family aminotransferase n=1 Tax=Methanocalculus sp. TaxID=2004547 RepID=UPI002608CC65
ILAAIGIEQLKKLPGILADRIRRAGLYTDLLKEIEGVVPPFVSPGTRHVFQSYCIYLEEDGIRDRLKQDLGEKGIETQIGTYALHQEPSYADVRRSGDLQNSVSVFKNLLTLPLHHELTDEDQGFVVKSISSLLKGYKE